MTLYTAHAEERLAARLIKRAWVEAAIKNPDKLIKAKFGRKQAIKKINSEEISVIYAKEGDNHIVITVFWGR